MKHIVLYISLSCFILWAECAKAQSWATVGVEGFSSGNVSNPRIACDPAGTPYVAYEDFGDSGLVTVKKFDGSSWVTVGAPGLPGSNATYWSFYISLAIDKFGTPYVFFKENADSGRATVMKYDGTNWVVVGTRRFTGPGIYFQSIAMDTAGIPYVAYQDSVNSGKATVMKYDGTNWVTVGSAGFSAGIAGSTYITIDRNNTPYVAYTDYYGAEKATVAKYDGSNWVFVGTPGFSAGPVDQITIAIDSAGTPYVAYPDGVSGIGTVMKYNGSTWVPVGSAISPASAGYTSIVIDRSGVPYVSYMDGADSQKVTVTKYNGSSWVTVGSADFSAPTDWLSIALDGKGTPYVIFADVADSGKATVMSFDTVATLLTNNIGKSVPTSISLFPNPAQNALTVTSSCSITSMLICNELGQTVIALKGSNNKVKVDVSNLPAGTYLVSVNGTEVRKFVKE